MTPEELRADIPVCQEGIYLNTGASGPATQRVVDAVSEFVAYHETEAPSARAPTRLHSAPLTMRVRPLRSSSAPSPKKSH